MRGAAADFRLPLHPSMTRGPACGRWTRWRQCGPSESASFWFHPLAQEVYPLVASLPLSERRMASPTPSRMMTLLRGPRQPMPSPPTMMRSSPSAPPMPPPRPPSSQPRQCGSPQQRHVRPRDPRLHPRRHSQGISREVAGCGWAAVRVLRRLQTSTRPTPHRRIPRGLRGLLLRRPPHRLPTPRPHRPPLQGRRQTARPLRELLPYQLPPFSTVTTSWSPASSRRAWAARPTTYCPSLRQLLFLAATSPTKRLCCSISRRSTDSKRRPPAMAAGGASPSSISRGVRTHGPLMDAPLPSALRVRGRMQAVDLCLIFWHVCASLVQWIPHAFI